MRRLPMLLAFFAFSTAFQIGNPAMAQKRVALIIGNASYAHAGALRNPVRDAEALGAAFERLKFDKVTVRQNLGAQALREALLDFERDATGADIAVVYFAGHGIEVDGQNYLIPVDAQLARAAAIDIEAMPLSTVTNLVAGARNLRLIILDACRNNPFRARLAAETGLRRSIGRGLARVEPGQSTLIAFAAREGTEADDGRGNNSPFTTALLQHIETPGLEVDYLFRVVRDDVLQATGRQQTPHLYGSLGRERVYLKPSADATTPAISVLSQSDAAREWLAVDKTSLIDLETFIRRHGASPEAEYANARAEALRTAARTIAPSPAPQPSASSSLPQQNQKKPLDERSTRLAENVEIEKYIGRMQRASGALAQYSGVYAFGSCLKPVEGLNSMITFALLGRSLQWSEGDTWYVVRLANPSDVGEYTYARKNTVTLSGRSVRLYSLTSHGAHPNEVFGFTQSSIWYQLEKPNQFKSMVKCGRPNSDEIANIRGLRERFAHMGQSSVGVSEGNVRALNPIDER